MIAKDAAEAMIGSLNLRANDLYEWSKQNIFIDKPFDYVAQNDLGKYCNLKKYSPKAPQIFLVFSLFCSQIRVF